MKPQIAFNLQNYIQKFVLYLTLPLHDLIMKNHRLRIITGVAFLTDKNTTIHFLHLKNKSEGSESAYHKSLTNTFMWRFIRAVVFLLLTVCLTIVYQWSLSSFTTNSQSIFYSLYFFITILSSFLVLHFKNLMELNTKINGIVGFKKQKQKEQKGVYITEGGLNFVMGIKGVLIFEYFKYMANPLGEVISFKKVNKSIISQKILNIWGLTKTSTTHKLLAKKTGANFWFLEVETHHSKSNYEMLENLSNLLSERGFLKAKKLLDEHFFGSSS